MAIWSSATQAFLSSALGASRMWRCPVLVIRAMRLSRVLARDFFLGRRSAGSDGSASSSSSSMTVRFIRGMPPSGLGDCEEGEDRDSVNHCACAGHGLLIYYGIVGVLIGPGHKLDTYQLASYTVLWENLAGFLNWWSI